MSYDRGDRGGGGGGGRGPPKIDGMYSLKVDNLTYRTSPETLKREFEKYGDVGDVYIPRDRYTRESRGFAFVRYYDKRDAEDAMETMDGKSMDGRELRVQMASIKRNDYSQQRYGRPESQGGHGGGGGGRYGDRDRGGGRYGGGGGGRGYRGGRSPRRKSYSRSRSRSRDRNRKRSSSRSRSRSASKSRSRSRDKKRSRSKERERSRTPEKNGNRSRSTSRTPED